jgi:hypothetical protein
MLLAFDVDVVAIAEVIAFATASYVDEAVHRLALAQGLTDIALGILQGNLSSDYQFDVEVLRVVDFFLCHIFRFWIAKI